MKLPSQQDLADAPLWENYLVAQAVQACLGLIPVHVMAIGMRASGAQVELVFRAAIWTAQDQEDAEDIVSELEALLGPEVSVHQKIEAPVSARVLASPGLRWIFAARSDTR